MRRPLTTSLAAPPPARDEPEEQSEPAVESRWRDLAPIVSALLVTLEIMEVSHKAGPALKAHRSTLRRQGEAAARLGGAEAMEAALRQVAEANPARAEGRDAIIREAWAGLPGWQPA